MPTMLCINCKSITSEGREACVDFKNGNFSCSYHQKGTPKSLYEAINNGRSTDILDGTESIRLHVKDFLAQKFTCMILQAHKRPLNEHEIHAWFEKMVN